MAYITTDNNYITALCSKCGRKVKVDTSTGSSNGVKNWYTYGCQYCGYIGSVETELDKILEMNKPIKEDPLKRIADSLDEIKELLKEVFNS